MGTLCRTDFGGENFSVKTYEELLATMEKTYSSLTGFSPDNASDIGIRIKVLATVCSELYQKLAQLQRDLFAQTAIGTYLDMHAQTRGISRKQAVPSTGILRFSRDSAALSDIVIPKGTLCACSGTSQLRFVTTEQKILEKGSLFVDVPAQSQSGGEETNTAANTITILVTPPQGISRVTNPAPFTGGSPAETDVQLRKRLLDSYRSISNGTNAAFYNNLALQADSIVSAHVIPRARGRGTVDVIIADEHGTASPELIAELQEEMEKQREINVDVAVKSAEILPVNLSLSFRCNTGYDPEETAKICANTIEEVLQSYQIASPLYLCDLYAILHGLPQLSSYTFPDFTEIIPQDTQILRLNQVNATCGEEEYLFTFPEEES